MSTNNDSGDKKNNDYERRTQTTRNEEFDPSKINEHVKRLTHKLPSNHQPHKVIVCLIIDWFLFDIHSIDNYKLKAGETGKTETFYKSKLKPKELLFLKNCKDCTFNVETTCTKVMIGELSDNLFFLESIYSLIFSIRGLWKRESNTLCQNSDKRIRIMEMQKCWSICMFHLYLYFIVLLLIP